MTPDQVAAWLRRAGTAGVEEMQRSMLRAGALVETQAKANASGRPGPRVQTGNLRRSINTRAINDETVSIGTPVEYGPRLEYGFVGRDALGRNVSQPPYPFLLPALEQSENRILSMIQTDLARAIGTT